VAPVGEVHVAGGVHGDALGPSRPVNDSTVWRFDPAANLTTRLVPSNTCTLPAGTKQNHRIWYDSTIHFAVTLPSTPADQGEQQRTVTNAYSQVAGMHE
jgi:hypothetical protein